MNKSLWRLKVFFLNILIDAINKYNITLLPDSVANKPFTGAPFGLVTEEFGFIHLSPETDHLLLIAADDFAISGTNSLISRVSIPTNKYDSARVHSISPNIDLYNAVK